MTSTDTPVARLSSPGEIAAALPYLCGFAPQESLVLIALAGPRRRLVLAMRMDLGEIEAKDELVPELVDRLVLAGADAAVLVVCTDVAGRLPRAPLVAAVHAECAQAGVALTDGLLLRAGRWWSYLCENDACCPAGGTPVPGLTGGAGLLAAESALDGRVVRASRTELETSLAAPVLLEAVAADQRLAGAAARWSTDLRADRRRAEDAALARWSGAVDQQRKAAEPPDAEQAAALAVCLQLVQVRDAVLLGLADDAEHLLGLLLALARVTTAPYDVPVCTLLAVAAWARGDGAVANVALDRALAADPGYPLANLVRQGLDAQLGPPQVRRWLRASARASAR